jgi:pimeloyl-ACP methyl ester carboxylesterase
MILMEKKIIILHGWHSKIKRWTVFKKIMEQYGWQVFLPQLPGFGKIQLARPWDLTDYLDWLRRFIKNKQLNNFFLLGHSFGASIALKYAAQKPKELEKLVLVNSAGIRKKAGIKKNFFLILAKTGKLIFYILAREKDYFKANKMMKETMKRILKEDLSSILAKIKAQTLIIWGEKDKLTPIKDGHLLQKLIPNSKLIVYNDIGHNIPFKKTKELAREVNSFC